jgi:hypothetical protein
MDNDRPSLDLRYLYDVCPDENSTLGRNLMGLGFTSGLFQVPVIAVFTKYDQFKIDVEMRLEDWGDPPDRLNTEMEKIFRQQYLSYLREKTPWVRLEREDFVS